MQNLTRSTMFMEKAMRGVSYISIKTRLLLLAILLALLPYLSYQLAHNLQNQIIQQQITNQEQLTYFLSQALENQLASSNPLSLENQLTNQLPQLKLKEATIWLINEEGQTELVLGNLINRPEAILESQLAKLGQKLFPIKTTPTYEILEEKLYLKLAPILRQDFQGKPLSLMTPIKLSSNKILIYEQPLNSILQTLENFYFLVGLSSLILLTFILGLALIAWSFSKKLLELAQEVSQVFQNKKLTKLPDKPTFIQDEISNLRQQINQLLEQIIHHNDYLTQLPKSLRHELHNPINRLSLSLQQLEQNHPYLDLKSLTSSTQQLKQLINQLTEASSFEESLQNLQTTPTYPLPRLLDFINQINHPYLKIQLDNQIQNFQPKIHSDMFMLEILLDKLIENALDFSDPQEAVKITLAIQQQELVITIYNSGSYLPDNPAYLFKKMVSIRENQEEKIHLGLGLYLAQLIAEAHQANLSAQNKDKGVEFRLALRLVKD